MAAYFSWLVTVDITKSFDQTHPRPNYYPPSEHVQAMFDARNTVFAENTAINCKTAATAFLLTAPLFAAYAPVTSSVGKALGTTGLLFSSFYMYFMASNVRAIKMHEVAHVRFPLMPILDYTIHGTTEDPFSWRDGTIMWGHR